MNIDTLIAKIQAAKDEHYYWGYLGFTLDEGDFLIALLKAHASSEADR